MFTAFLRAVGQLGDPRVLRVLGYCVLLSIACFAVAWLAIAWLLSTPFFESGWLQTTVAVLGTLATLVLTWLLFPLLASAFVGVFLEPIATAVEARYYPDLDETSGIGFWAGIGAALRFLILIVVINLLLLLLLLFPPIYPIGYLAGNGYLIAREYFDLVAFRRINPVEARALRSRHSSELLAMGIVIAFLLTVPFVNFVAPVIGTAALLHRFEAWRRADSGGLDSA